MVGCIGSWIICQTKPSLPYEAAKDWLDKGFNNC